MDRDPPLTKRQEWIKFSGERQDKVNETLRDLQIEIEVANIRLAELYKEDPEAADAYGTEVVEYLDSKWAFKGDYFMVTGKWHEAVVGVGEHGLEVQHAEKEAFYAAQSNGFIKRNVEDDKEEEVPRVGMSFIMSNIEYSTPYFQGNFQPLSFAEPHMISLQYMRPGDASIVSTEVGEVTDALMRADALLHLYTNHEGSKFYQLSVKKQQKFLKSILDMVEEVFPVPESYDHVLIEDAETPHLFYRNPETGKLARINATDEKSKLSISGEVLGVTIADMMHDGENTHYGSANELVASQLGLSLIVSPSAANFDLPEMLQGRELLLPLRKLDALQISVE